MGATNSKRVSHNVDTKQNPWRGDDLRQIINDITEGLVGPCFQEVEYIVNTNFVNRIVVYSNSAKTKKRLQSDYTYLNGNPPFVSQIVTQVFNEEDGLSLRATVTEDIVYNANKTVQSVDTQIVRV